MAEAQMQVSSWEFSTVPVSNVAAAKVRERALADGLTVTTHKDGRLVQERMVAGKVVEVFSQTRERDTD